MFERLYSSCYNSASPIANASVNGADYIIYTVCMSVSEHISGTTRPHFTKFLPTALAWEVMQSPPFVCLSVRLSVRLFPLYLGNRLTVDLELLHVSGSWAVGHIAHRGLKVKVAGEGQGRESG